ncbi:MAG TPA: dihydrodipicolinate synthase family protein [Chthoniobacterales bacterium]|nr:dihydrodipicolinate synthase family protein [Chthoniobacterales bacterium]
MISNERFGLSCALATPFHEDLRIDHVRLANHARWCLSSGCSSVTLLGSTGEGASISLRERKEILSHIAETGIDLRQQVVGGIISSSIGEAVEQSKIFLDKGVRVLLVAPPFYFKTVSDSGLFEWYSIICKEIAGSGARAILYHIPPATQVSLSFELIDRLKRTWPSVVFGVKDSGGDWSYSHALLRAHRDLTILIGDERLLAAGMRAGASGSISGLANICPGVLKSIVEQGDENLSVQTLVSEILKHSVVPAIKALLAHCREDNAWITVRPPLVRCAKEAAAELASVYEGMFPGSAG